MGNWPWLRGFWAFWIGIVLLLGCCKMFHELGETCGEAGGLLCGGHRCGHGIEATTGCRVLVIL